ncbi:MAG: mechanosensitive ion channel family protein [Campylobacteraceae bacterium]|jgi:small-conductance mechanosensitive channel|nr:mechanosensitive ion channel family protein [Campylobacteraceae bacterium]
MKRIIFLFLFIVSAAFGEDFATVQKEYQSSKNIWLVSLQSYRNYIHLYQELETSQSKLASHIADGNTEAIASLKEEIDILQNNLNLQAHQNRQPLYELFEPLEALLKQFDSAKITPFSLLGDELERSAKQAGKMMKEYRQEYDKAALFIDALENRTKKQELLLTFANDKRLLRISLDTLEKTYESVLKQQEFYNKKADYYKSEELRQLFYILLAIVVVFVLINAMKLFLKFKRKMDKSEEYDQRYFMIRKILNILFVIITILIFAFTYVDNIAQVLAVFGVVGAGLTVVMKEWVLSYVGWFVLITSNSIQIGDRIKISKDGRSIIGDVINISLTKLTLYENITNDALTEHKKAGRVIFVPNYYLIMGEVYNYTHLSLKTILDLIEIRMTFDSNLEKAEKIGLESAELVTSRFTEMAKKQYDALKKRYTLRNMTTYPKVFFYPSAHGNGVVMGVWYVSPYREVLKHKSEIMKEIIARFAEENDIKLLYSGQSVFLENEIK